MEWNQEKMVQIGWQGGSGDWRCCRNRGKD